MLPAPWRRQFRSDRPIRTEKERKAAQKAAERLWGKFRRLMDSEPLPVGLPLTQEQIDEAMAAYTERMSHLPPGYAEVLDDRLLDVVTRLVAASFQIAREVLFPEAKPGELIYGLDETFVGPTPACRPTSARRRTPRQASTSARRRSKDLE